MKGIHGVYAKVPLMHIYDAASVLSNPVSVTICIVSGVVKHVVGRMPVAT